MTVTPWPHIYQPHIDRAQAALASNTDTRKGRRVLGRGRLGPQEPEDPSELARAEARADAEVMRPHVAAILLVCMAMGQRRTARTVCDALGFGGKNLDLDLTLARAIAANELGVREALPGLTLPARRMEQ